MLLAGRTGIHKLFARHGRVSAFALPDSQSRICSFQPGSGNNSLILILFVTWDHTGGASALLVPLSLELLQLDYNARGCRVPPGRAVFPRDRPAT